MTAPVPYDITTNFEDEEANAVSGRSTVRTAMVDVELQNIATTLASLIGNLELIQRDDGALVDGVVSVSSLAAEVLSLLSGTTIVPRGDWSSASVSYAVGNLVRYATDTNIYVCLQAHTSSGSILPTNTTYWMVWSYGFSSDAQLAAIAASSPVADRIHYWTSSTAVALATLTSFARTILDDADAATARATLGSAASNDALPDVFEARIVVADVSGSTLANGTTSPVHIGSGGHSEFDSNSGGYIWVAPFGGCQLSLWDGTNYRVLQLKQSVNATANPKVAVPAVANQMYDVFAFYNAADSAQQYVNLELVAWTNDTTRATGLVWHTGYGVVVKSGDATRRYLGTVRTGSVAGTVYDTPAQRFVWNMHNRQAKRMQNYPTANTYTYSVDSFREMNGATTARMEFINPGVPNQIRAEITALVTNDTATARRVQIGLGLNSASVASRVAGHGYVVTGENRQVRSSAVLAPTFGYNYIAPLERGAGTDTQTWYGTNGGAELAVGMSAMGMF